MKNRNGKKETKKMNVVEVGRKEKNSLKLTEKIESAHENI